MIGIVLFVSGLTNPMSVTSANLDEIKSAGKPYFLKFFAPWCGHCKKMAPAWEKLAKEFSANEVLIGNVDCTAHGKSLCDSNGIQGFPTIKYYDGFDDDGENYEGRREFDDMKSFVESSLNDAGCSPTNMEDCNDDMKSKMKEANSLSLEGLQARIDNIKKTIQTATETHESLLKKLQSQYEASAKSLEEVKTTTKVDTKVLNMIMHAKKKSKDEL